jgi:hypothetical protein
VPLTYIVNKSLKHGIFPEGLKIAIVKPIFKKGDANDPSSYRPISLLSSFSKIFEKVVSTKIFTFMVQQNLWSKSQHGYINKRSIDTALFQFMTKVHEVLDRGLVPCGIYLDLTKAFDCISHNILLKKMEKYGIRETPLK